MRAKCAKCAKEVRSARVVHFQTGKPLHPWCTAIDRAETDKLYADMRVRMSRLRAIAASPDLFDTFDLLASVRRTVEAWDALDQRMSFSREWRR